MYRQNNRPKLYRENDKLPGASARFRNGHEEQVAAEGVHRSVRWSRACAPGQNREVVETTAMSACRLPDPFTKYIFVDHDERCTEALTARIVTREQGLISFAFVDPFAANLKFQTIRALSSYKIDFLILLMLGRDARTNFWSCRLTTAAGAAWNRLANRWACLRAAGLRCSAGQLVPALPWTRQAAQAR